MTGKIPATPSHKFEEINPTPSDELLKNSATASHQFITAPEQLIAQFCCVQEREKRW